MVESCGSKLETQQMSNATHVRETYTNIRSPFDDQTVSCKCRATTLSKICSDFVRQIHNKVCWPFVGSTTMSDICRILQAWISSTCSAQNRAEKTLDKITTIGNEKRRSGKKGRQNHDLQCSANVTHCGAGDKKRRTAFLERRAQDDVHGVGTRLDKTTT